MRLSENSRLPGHAKILTLLLAIAVLLAAALVLVPGAQAQGSTERDRQLLTGLYFALGGAGWAESDYWLSDEPLDQWHGVTVANGRVVGLDLSGNGLTGRIPPGLSLVFDPSDFDIRLKELDLSNNQLSGRLPSGFVPLFPHLEVLKASGNQFIGPIPPDVTSLSELTWLDLDNNDFSGQIPPGFGSLSGLTVLRLGGNDFSGPIPAELGRLSKLSILGLGNNRLSGEIPAELGNLTALTRISVFGNQLNGPIPPELGQLSNLTRLSLGNNKLSGAIPAKLGNLSNLREFYFDGNPALSGCVPSSLEGQLTSYDFGDLGFCGAGSKYDTDSDGLIEVSNLEQLDAIRYDLDGDGSPSDAEAYAAAFPVGAGETVCAKDCIGYELTRSLDFDANGNGRADSGDTYWNDGAGWEPIGRNHRKRYTATFDGNGHTLSNLYISRGSSHFIGLFGATGVEAIIRHVGMISVNVTGNAGVGGLVGDNVGGTIIGSFASGSVTSLGWNAGGLVGYNGDSAGDGEGGSTRVITGKSKISGSYASVTVKGHQGVGGLVGHNGGGGDIAASYATGNVTGNDGVGGLVGYAVDTGITSNSYWDTQTSWLTSSSGGRGKTTAELQAPTGYTGIYATWDDTEAGDVWDFGTSSDYPRLKGVTPASTPSPTPTPTATPVPEDNIPDRVALVAIYDAMGGKEWSRQKNWKDPDIHIGEWEGVTTDRDTGRVTHLNLNGRGLTGNVPDEVVNLTALRELRLSHNSLTGEIPPWMSSNQLSSLELLNLSNNRLSGQIPVSLADLPSLTTLVLHGNQFTGCIPLALKGLVPTGLASLPEFCLSLEQKEKKILMELHEAVGSPTLTNWGKYDQPLEAQGDQPYSTGWEGVGVDENGRVKELLLAGKMLRGDIPWEQLAKLEGLEYLDLSENGLSGAIEVPHQLGPLENLYHLDLGGNTLSGEIPPQLSRFRNLKLLDLSRNQFTGAIPEELADLKNLRHDGLRLFGHKFDGCIPRVLKGRLAVSYFAPRYVDPGGNIVSRILDMVNVYFPDYIQSYLSQILSQEDLVNAMADVNPDNPLRDILKPNSPTFKKIATAIPGFGSIFDVLDLLTQDWFMRWVKGSTDVTYGLGAPPCAPDLPAPATSLERQSLDSDKTALLAIRQYFIDYEKGDDGEGPVNEYDDGGENVYTFTRDDSLIGGRNFNWPAQGHISQWHGVTVENGRVVRLEITERLLEGEIPPEVGDLGALKRLNLSRNRLSGPIPKELGNLVNLEHLSLNGKRDLCGQKYDGTNCDANRLSGEIPKGLGHLTKLKALHLHENNFEGEVPLELGNATGLGPNNDNLDQNDPQLREVNFSSSGLTGCLPPNLQGNFDTPIGARFAAYLARIVAFTAVEVAIPIVGAAVSVFDYLIGGRITSLVDWATNTSASFITRQGAFHSDLGDVKLYCDPDPALMAEPSPASGQRSPW